MSKKIKLSFLILAITILSVFSMGLIAQAHFTRISDGDEGWIYGYGYGYADGYGYGYGWKAEGAQEYGFFGLSPFADGTGTEEDPFQIETCQQLQDMNFDNSGETFPYLTGNYYFILNDDIDCSMTNPTDPDFDAEGTWGDEAGFMPIGYTSDDENEISYGASFTGTFDGNDKTISGLYINRPDFDYVGLFGEAGDYGEGYSLLIQDLTLTDVDITGQDYVGGLFGEVILNTDGPGIISNVHVSGEVTGAQSIGGLVGYLNQSNVTESSSSAVVEGSMGVGDLVGYNNNGEISLSRATGYVNGTILVGGLVGINEGQIYTSYATGNVSGLSRLGGLVGVNSSGRVQNTYATGNVSGNGRIGGLVGETDSGDIVTSYATGDVSGSQYIGGLVGENDLTSIYSSYSVGTLAGSTYVGGLVGHFDGDGASYENFVDNLAWYKGSQNLNGIGYDAFSSAGAEVAYAETSNSVFYSSSHEIYTEGAEVVWDFEETWTEQVNDYPLLTSNLEDREIPEVQDLDLDITRVSVDDEGEEGTDDSYKFGGSYDLSENGRYIAFVSQANNLTTGDLNEGEDIFLYDTETETIEIISLDPNGEQFSGNVYYPSISDDGRYVSFTAYNGEYYYIYLRDRTNATTAYVDLATDFEVPIYSSISSDGQKIIVSYPLYTGVGAAYLYDVATEDVTGGEDFGTSYFRASISKNGEYVILGSTADGIVEGDDNGINDIFVADLELSSVERVSLTPEGEQFNADDVDLIFAPFISEDGRYVTFTTYTYTNSPMGYSTVYLRDRETDTTTEIYQSDSGLFNYYISSISNDGQFIAFASSAMSTGISVGNSPVYLYNTETEETTTLIEGSNNNSVTISGDGNYLAFVSNRTDLVADDTNNVLDVFRIANPLIVAEDPEPVVIHQSSGSSATYRNNFLNNNTPVPTTPLNDCLAGYLFSPSTGRACNGNSSIDNPKFTFTKNLKLLDVDNDVKELQKFLNTHGFPVSTTGPGSLGNETTKFGALTKAALIKFQKSKNITPALGYFGTITRGVVNSML